MYVIMVRDPDLTPPSREGNTSLAANKVFGDLLEVRDFLEEVLLRTRV
jgi:hypothetical protein